MNAQNSSGNKPKVNLTKKNKSNTFRSIIFTLLSIIFIAYCINLYGNHNIKMKEVPLSDVISRANDEHGNIKRITVSGNELEITLKDKDIPTETSRKDPSGTLYDQGLINRCADKAGDDLKKCQEKYPVINYVDPINYTEIFINILTIAVPIIIAVIFFGRLLGQAQSINKENMGFGKARAKLYGPDKKRVLFTDVAGNEAAKQDLSEVVDFLKNPKKYEKLGAKIPRGVLLAGDPGTGKTLMARAVAGEANVPFFSISGSEFAEMFVGVGASRVRDLFSKAKKNAPSIIFIDEIDAVAHKRDARGGAGREDEQTLNQILVEMDGFDNESGVIVIAATNRVDMLDKALLRAGRFDRQIHVDLPDLPERKDIFLVHMRNLKLDKNLDIDLLARQTPGFSGADIANVCNEAALIAARHDSKEVAKQDFLDAVDRIIGGLEKKTKVMTADEKRTIALHEAGHATISWFCEHANPLVKVSIVPRGQALGAAWYLPEERPITTKEQMLDEMCSLLGGRAAEELFTGHISTGAMNDLERATKSAYGMIAYAGMSDRLPNICYYNNDEYNFQKPYSDTTAKMIDEEVLKMINGQYERAKQILTEHKEGHNRLAQLLVEREVIMAEDVEAIFGKRPWVSRTEELLDQEVKSQPKLEDMPEAVKQAQAEHEAQQRALNNNATKAEDDTESNNTAE